MADSLSPESNVCNGTGADVPVEAILSVEKAQRMAEFFGVLGGPKPLAHPIGPGPG